NHETVSGPRLPTHQIRRAPTNQLHWRSESREGSPGVAQSRLDWCQKPAREQGRLIFLTTRRMSGLVISQLFSFQLSDVGCVESFPRVTTITPDGSLVEQNYQ